MMTFYQVTDIAKALQLLEQILSDVDHTHHSHIPGTAEVSPKLQLPTEQLVHYLQERHGLKQEREPVIRQFKHGQSNPTYYVGYAGEEMVLRKKPVRCGNRSKNNILLPVVSLSVC